MADIPKWQLDGDWFDVCKCDIPCPCEFARPPTYGDCEGILVWHVRKGTYGDVALDGLSVIALGYFKGNIWEGAKATMGIFIDARADDRQRAALQTIFGGQAGGWPGQFAQNIAEIRGVEFVADRVRVGGRPGDVASRDSRQGRSEGRGVERPHDAAGQARPDDQSPGIRGRAGRRRDLGHGDRRSRRRVRLQVEPQRAVEQAHSVLVERPRLTAAVPAAMTPERRYAARGVRPPLLAHQPARGRRAGRAVGARVAQHDRAGERDERHGDGARPHRQPLPGHDERRRAAHDVGDDDGGDDAAHRRADGARASRRHAPAGRRHSPDRGVRRRLSPGLVGDRRAADAGVLGIRAARRRGRRGAMAARASRRDPDRCRGVSVHVVEADCASIIVKARSRSPSCTISAAASPARCAPEPFTACTASAAAGR